MSAVAELEEPIGCLSVLPVQFLFLLFFFFRICNKAYLQCCDFIAKVAFILGLPHSHQSPTEQLSLIP